MIRQLPVRWLALLAAVAVCPVASAGAATVSAVSPADTLDSRAPLIDITYPAGGEVFRYTEQETLLWTIDEQSFGGAAPVNWTVVASGGDVAQGDLAAEAAGHYAVVFDVTPWMEAGTQLPAQLIVTAVDRFGWSAADTSAVFDILDDVTDVPGAALVDRLGAAHPNPFNPSTTIAFSLQAPAQVELAVYDVRGQRVATLFSGVRGAGEHRALWLGRGADGRAVSSGVYFARLQIRGADRDQSFVTRLTLVN